MAISGKMMHLCRRLTGDHKWPDRAEFRVLCLECAAIFRHLAVNGPVGLGVYTKAMMINRILTICAAVAAGMAGASFAHAQQGYPLAPGPAYSAAPGPYVQGGYQGGYAVDERRGPGARRFRRDLDDDDAPNAQSSTALPPPGPVLSPADPRYGRPAGAPVYSDRGAPMPTGPILSPDDPRYGRPAGAPVYSDRGAPMPTGPVLSPDDPRYGRPAGPPAVIYAGPSRRFAATDLFGSRRQSYSRCRHRLSERRSRWLASAGGASAPPERSRNRSNPPSELTAGRCSLPRCRRKSSRMLRPCAAAAATCAARK